MHWQKRNFWEGNPSCIEKKKKKKKFWVYLGPAADHTLISQARTHTSASAQTHTGARLCAYTWVSLCTKTKTHKTEPELFPPRYFPAWLFSSSLFRVFTQPTKDNKSFPQCLPCLHLPVSLFLSSSRSGFPCSPPSSSSSSPPLPSSFSFLAFSFLHIIISVSPPLLCSFLLFSSHAAFLAFLLAS